MKHCLRNWWVHCLFLLIALAVLYPWFMWGVLPVESADEAGHTFVEIPLYFRELIHGHFSLINLFNNFGTPLVGEAVFNPWAPHSLTYLIAPEYTGIMVNKVLILFLTLEVLFHYGLRMSLSRKFAIWFAVMTATNPAILYFLNHHPHMGALLYFSTILLTFERLIERFTLGRLVCLLLSYLCLLIGVGINGVVLAHVFLPIYFLSSLKKLNRGQWFILILGLAGVLMICLPHFIAFLEWAPHSVRSATTLFDFPGRGRYVNASLMLIASTIFLFLTKFHVDYTVLQTSIVQFIFLFAFFATIWRRDVWKRNSRVGWNFLFSAAITAIVYTLLVRIDWLAEVPFFKASDVTRFFWFSMLFVNLGAALLLEFFFERRRPWPMLAASIVAFALLAFVARFYFATIPSGFDFVRDTDFWLLVTGAVAIAAITVHIFIPLRPRLVGAILSLTFLPRILVFILVCGMHLSEPGRFGLIPRNLERKVEPFRRLASVYDTDEAPDQRLALYSVFGSAGRSIIQSRELKEYLASLNLIEGNLYQYRFKRDAIDRLDPLGISYVLARDERLASNNWEYVDGFLGYEKPYFLYRNRTDVSPVYCDSDPREFIRAEYLVNEIRVQVPHACSKLIATFYSWPGWKISIGDGAKFSADPSHIFLRAENVGAGESVRFSFEPWAPKHWWAFLCGGFILIAIVTRRLREETE